MYEVNISYPLSENVFPMSGQISTYREGYGLPAQINSFKGYCAWAYYKCPVLSNVETFFSLSGGNKGAAS